MNDKKPWEVAGVPWKSEAAFWSWVRGVLRKGWSKHPVKLEYIKQNRQRIVNPSVKSRTRFPKVWGMQCAICNQEHVQTNIEIDHVGQEGHFRGLSDAEAYIAHLFLVDFDNLRALCKPCHKVVSYSQRTGTSFDEAALSKKVIEICKKEPKELLAYLASYGYNGNSVSNATKRKALVTQILKEKA